jgi:uncharacterized membrane protein
VGESAVVLLLIFFAAVLFGGALLGIVAFGLLLGTRRRVADLARRLERLSGERAGGETASEPAIAEAPPVAAEPESVALAPEARPAGPEPPAPEPAATDAASPIRETAPPPRKPILPLPPPALDWEQYEETAARQRHVRAWSRHLDRMAGPATPKQPSGPDWAQLESLLGTRWLTWAGVLALFFAVAFAVKYAFERGWISPPIRVGLGVAAGLALLAAGAWAARKAMRTFGQALMGGGLAMLYTSLYAAFAFYGLMRQQPAFAAMVVVTAGGMALSIWHDALAISFMAVLGGILTPVLLSTGVDARDTLFTYLILLDLGVLAVALFRRWRALDVLAFAGTVMLYAGWFVQFYRPPAMVPAVLWLGAFYVVFLMLPFVHHLRHRELIAAERVGMAVGNAALAFAGTYGILGMEHRHVLGFIAMAMSACYVVLARLVRRRIPEDSQGLLAMSALAVALLSIAVPLHLKLEALALVWAVEAPLLVYLGYRYRYGPVRSWAILPLIAAALRVATLDRPMPRELFQPFWNPLFGTALAVAAAAWALAWIHQLNAADARPMDSFLKRSAALAGGLFALLYAQADAGLHFRRMGDYYTARCAVMGVWAAGALAYLGAGLRLRSAWSLRAGLLSLSVACAVGAWAYKHTAPQGYALVLNLRFAAVLAVVGAVFCHGFLLRRWRNRFDPPEDTLSRLMPWAAIGALLGLLSAEAYSWGIALPVTLARAEWTARMSLSLVWGVYAAVLLALGFWRRRFGLRMAALALFGATALKLVLLDMIGVKQVYRIVSFLVLGALMVGAAYAYHRVERRLSKSAPDGD